MGIATTGDIAARAIHRHDALPQTNAGLGFDLERAQARALGQGEAPHPVMGESDVVPDLRGDAVDQASPLRVAEQEVAFPAIELAGEFDDRGLATLLDVCQHPGRDGADALVLHPGVGLRLFDVLHAVRLRQDASYLDAS